jgi:hypothetical protein
MEEITPAKSRRPILLATALGVVLGGAVVGGIVLATSGGGSSAPPVAVSSATTTTSPAPTTTIAAPKDPGALQLVTLLEAGSKLAFHATYEASGAQFTAQLDLWHKGAQSRRDTMTTVSSGQVQTRELAVNNSDVQCVHEGTVPWTCTTTPLDPTKNPGDLTFGNASKFFQGVVLTPSTTTLSGRPAQCFTQAVAAGSAAPAAPYRFCTTPDGIPLLIDTGQGPITLTALDMTPPADSVFTTPAGAIGV